MKLIDKKIEGAKAHLDSLIREKYPRIDEPYNDKDYELANHVFRLKRDMTDDEMDAVYELLSVFLGKPANAIRKKIHKRPRDGEYVIDRKTPEQEAEEKRIRDGGAWVPFHEKYSVLKL